MQHIPTPSYPRTHSSQCTQFAFTITILFDKGYKKVNISAEHNLRTEGRSVSSHTMIDFMLTIPPKIL